MTQLHLIKLHILSLCSCGIIAYIITNLFHELMGHGLASLLLGNEITLISSVYFRSVPHSFLTDAAGPVMNLIGGLFFFVVLKRTSTTNTYLKLALLFTTAFNLFFFSWLCIYGGITNTGDLSFAIAGTTNTLLWRIALVFLGLLLYYFFFIAIFQSSREIFSTNAYSDKFLTRAFVYPYISAGLTALLAASFFEPMIFANFYEAFVFPMFLPMIFIPRYLKVLEPAENPVISTQAFQLRFISFAAIVLITFCLTMGAGI